MALLPDVDPDGLLEYSVVYTDRALNHMSGAFQQVMRDLYGTFNSVYGASASVIVPGSGTFAMEAVARQFATGRKCLVIRNGWFSYRWTQILEMGELPEQEIVLKARKTGEGTTDPFTPAPLEEVIATIENEKPDVVFAPHVETSAGMILPDDYIAAVARAVHDAGGIMVLDCIASGAIWVDMAATGVDVLVSAPQKGWSASPCCGVVMLGERGLERLAGTRSNSFSCDLGKWHDIMQAYVNGGHAYHATMPTDGLVRFRDVMNETAAFGFDTARERQQALGAGVRQALEARGIASVAAPGFQAPGVVVCYTDSDGMHNGSLFAAQGMQIAAGVPLMVDEPADFKSFRIGLFGLDKLKDVERTVATFEAVLDKVLASAA